MSFSEVMRDSLGAAGARLAVSVEPPAGRPGDTLTARITVSGGSQDAVVEGLRLRVVEARRYWLDGDDRRVEDVDAPGRAARAHLRPMWDLRDASDGVVERSVVVAANAQSELEIEFQIPSDCAPSADACTVRLNVQADIKGQIDPTGNARLVVRPEAPAADRANAPPTVEDPSTSAQA